MATDLIRYDLLVQDALRGAVRTVLQTIARDGLPGEHHCFITFRTQADGVRISTALRQRFPQEMTVVLQHQFWGLEVTEHAFEVGLHFAGVPERILVPFDSIVQFDDPSVGFRLQFQVADAPAAKADAKSEARPTPKGAASEPAVLPAPKAEPKAKAEKKAEKAAKPAASDGPKVVSIDAFRKK